MDAIERGDLIEHATMTRVAEIYAGALQKALKKKKAFLQKIKDLDSGKIQPPQYYVDLDMVDKWREGFVRELMRQQAVIEDIMEELNAAGVDAAALIRKSMVDIYQANREEMVQKLSDAAISQGVNVSFAQYDKRQIAVLLQEQESPFTKLAYENMGKNPAIRRRLQNELAMAIILGESQAKIIKRIRAVTGQSIAQARRVAQTERTRVQSQARHLAGQEAAEKGIGIVNEWSARMVNTRESHADLNGKKVMQGEKFRTIWGNELEFPGDPSAPAKEVINCFCVLAPDVLLPGQRLVDGKVVEAEKAVAAAEGMPAFVPAKNIEEAEAFARAFTSKHRDWDGPCTYKGVELEYANEMNRAMHDVFHAFGFERKLRSIQPFNRRKAAFKDTTAEAAYQWGLNDLYYNKDYYKSSKAFQAHKKQYNDLLAAVMPNLDAAIAKVKGESGYTAKSKLKYYEALKKTGRTNVSPPDAYGTIIHEMGHFLDDATFGRMYRADRFDMKASYERYADGISAYATASRQEYVAESFTAWWMGETANLDPQLVAYFERGRVK